MGSNRGHCLKAYLLEIGAPVCVVRLLPVCVARLLPVCVAVVVLVWSFGSGVDPGVWSYVAIVACCKLCLVWYRLKACVVLQMLVVV